MTLDEAAQHPWLRDAVKEASSEKRTSSSGKSAKASSAAAGSAGATAVTSTASG